jgi:hypothetical protein
MHRTPEIAYIQESYGCVYSDNKGAVWEQLRLLIEIWLIGHHQCLPCPTPHHEHRPNLCSIHILVKLITLNTTIQYYKTYITLQVNSPQLQPLTQTTHFFTLCLHTFTQSVPFSHPSNDNSHAIHLPMPATRQSHTTLNHPPLKFWRSLL